MTSFINLSKYMAENAELLAGEVVEAVLRKMNLNIPLWEKEQATRMYVELLGFLGESLMDEDQDTVPNTLIEWSKKNAAMQVSSGGKISEIVVRYPPTRTVFNEIFTRVSTELGLSLKENAFIIKQINMMLDVSLNETIFAFERLSDQFREETQKELAALSAPIVPVKDGIVILPLVGDIDAYKADHIMEHVIPIISTLEVDHVIADFSGILTINKQIAEYFHQMGETLRLMGVHVITTGLRPELAQTVVNSKISLSTIESYANVKQALESIK